MVDNIEILARRLLQARRTRTVVPSPGDALAIDSANAVCERSIDERLAAGETIVAYKISGSAGHHHPTYGALFSGEWLQSPAAVPLATGFAPIVEAELIFLLDHDLSTDPDEQELLEKCRVAAGFEISDSCYREWRNRLAEAPAPDQAWIPSASDIAADNSFAWLIVTGNAVPAKSLDLRAIDVSLSRDGTVIATGSSAAVMGNPANAVLWLCAALARRGDRLLAGQAVATGTISHPGIASPALFEAAFSGIGSVRLEFQ